MQVEVGQQSTEEHKSFKRWEKILHRLPYSRVLESKGTSNHSNTETSQKQLEESITSEHRGGRNVSLLQLQWRHRWLRFYVHSGRVRHSCAFRMHPCILGIQVTQAQRGCISLAWKQRVVLVAFKLEFIFYCDHPSEPGSNDQNHASFTVLWLFSFFINLWILYYNVREQVMDNFPQLKVM